MKWIKIEMYEVLKAVHTSNFCDQPARVGTRKTEIFEAKRKNFGVMGNPDLKIGGYFVKPANIFILKPVPKRKKISIWRSNPHWETKLTFVEVAK